jgi:hypothetical protein
MTLYFALALFSTGIFVVQFLLSMFVADTDFDTDTDIDLDGSADFSMSDLVSFKGLIHFLIGFSWTMWFWQDGNQFVAAMVAVAVGLVFVLVLAFVYWGALHLKNEIRPERGDDLIGREGEVYLRNRDGSYLIYTEINGTRRELKVYHDGTKNFQTGSIVRISSYSNGKYYIY